MEEVHVPLPLKERVMGFERQIASAERLLEKSRCSGIKKESITAHAVHLKRRLLEIVNISKELLNIVNESENNTDTQAEVIAKLRQEVKQHVVVNTELGSKVECLESQLLSLQRKLSAKEKEVHMAWHRVRQEVYQSEKVRSIAESRQKGIATLTAEVALLKKRAMRFCAG